ncbi:MAG: bifunctional diguanylate cyclase/phosphodiesterase [Sphingomonas sp.]|uniref:putative bifunctional diguanylate cyclase/phosphodiesterase n=1 Tax=Sphingomonas sp. TaxID=28214 RepID=UPI000DB51A01|nr:bifunctional diguanylate cyclase/phosphodiesterase [Sphingomonas sp.]PZP19715.1 MAG: GGDEF-domain containing protein [Sphingomonas hengshuiensis]
MTTHPPQTRILATEPLSAQPASAAPDRLGRLITIAATAMFVATGGAALSVLFDATGGISVDRVLLIALLLNIALILFGWRRDAAMREAALLNAAAEARALAQATRDPLTGLVNRRALVEDGCAMIAQAKRRYKAVALLMINIDQFRRINHHHGHAIGDALLREFADVIAVIAPAGALIARPGGDGFACAVLFDPAVPQTVDRLAEQLMSRMATPFTIAGLELHLSASIGIARTDADNPTIESLLRSADIALGAAKAAGGRQTTWFDASMERALQARADIADGLRRAIPAYEFIPYFDPQIDLTTGQLTAFEMLARWNHPQHGIITPESFIAIAEETGAMNELSFALMRHALVEARDWDPGLKLSVNIAPSQIGDARFAQRLLQLLTETGFPAERLEVEITEAALFADLAMAQTVIASLKNQGIGIVLDDFGTGYSSLAHLRALPFDRLKIDRSFIASINDSGDSAAIVTAIVRLGESLNLTITAEGVEDATTAARMQAMGASRAQGYHYGKPMNPAHTRAVLAQRHLLQRASAFDGAEQSAGVRQSA